MKIRNVIASTACGLLLTAASPAFAQRANGPYSGLFGGPPDANRTQGLDLHGSMFGAWDENVFSAAADPAQIDPRLRNSGGSVGLSGSLTYYRRSDRAEFKANGGANGQQYVSSPDLVAAYAADASLTTKLSPSVSFIVGGGAAYSPFFQFAPFLDAGIATPSPLGGGFGYAALAERNLGLDASAGLTDNLTSRTSLYITATGRDWQLLDSPQDNLRTWGAHAGIRHNLTRSLGVHVGYGRDENQYATQGVAPYVAQTIDAGVDYGNTLMFARRVSFTFGTSTEVVQYNNANHFRLNGTRPADARLPPQLEHVDRIRPQRGVQDRIPGAAADGLGGRRHWRPDDGTGQLVGRRRVYARHHRVRRHRLQFL